MLEKKPAYVFERQQYMTVGASLARNPPPPVKGRGARRPWRPSRIGSWIKSEGKLQLDAMSRKRIVPQNRPEGFIGLAEPTFRTQHQREQLFRLDGKLAPAFVWRKAAYVSQGGLEALLRFGIVGLVEARARVIDRAGDLLRIAQLRQQRPRPRAQIGRFELSLAAECFAQVLSRLEEL